MSTNLSPRIFFIFLLTFGPFVASLLAHFFKSIGPNLWLLLELEVNTFPKTLVTLSTCDHSPLSTVCVRRFSKWRWKRNCIVQSLNRAGAIIFDPLLSSVACTSPFAAERRAMEVERASAHAIPLWVAMSNGSRRHSGSLRCESCVVRDLGSQTLKGKSCRSAGTFFESGEKRKAPASNRRPLDAKLEVLPQGHTVKIRTITKGKHKKRCSTEDF